MVCLSRSILKRLTYDDNIFEASKARFLLIKFASNIVALSAWITGAQLGWRLILEKNALIVFIFVINFPFKI